MPMRPKADPMLRRRQAERIPSSGSSDGIGDGLSLNNRLVAAIGEREGELRHGRGHSLASLVRVG